MTNNDIKHREAGQLIAYLDTLDREERSEFVSLVTKQLDIKRHIFFNWKYMLSRIPPRAKEMIEAVAGELIFVNPESE